MISFIVEVLQPMIKCLKIHFCVITYMHYIHLTYFRMRRKVGWRKSMREKGWEGEREKARVVKGHSPCGHFG